jgi:hypothetical protein
MEIKNPFSGPGAPTFTILLVAIGLVAFAVFIWAAFYRKPDDKHHHGRHHWRSPRREKTETERSSGRKRWFGLKRHRRRRKDRPTNPTLAETGGLPPMRPDEPEGSSKD